MPQASSQYLVDRALNGRLAEFLAAWRHEGLSYNSISRRLALEYHINITNETLRRWCNELIPANGDGKQAS